MSDDILKIIIDKVDKLDNKIDGIAGDIVEIKITSAKQNESLNYHIKRSDLNEENIEILRKEVEPIKSHVIAVNSIIKFVGIFSTIIGTILGIFKLLKKF